MFYPPPEDRPPVNDKPLVIMDRYFSQEDDEDGDTLTRSVVDELMRQWESSYCDYLNLKIFAGTYNVNGQEPTVGLSSWLADGLKDAPDIYAIGFQELDLTQSAFVNGWSKREVEWARVVKNGLHPAANYFEVKRERLVGMLLFVFAKTDLKKHIDDGLSLSDKVATGLLNRFGNKGAVGVSCKLYDTRLCFVNSHLAAGTDELERRNSDFTDIVNKMLFGALHRESLTVLDHDAVLWLGDLNYRLDSRQDNAEVRQRCSIGQYEALLQKDQLKLMQSKSAAFIGFSEGPIEFAPTYKYDPGTDNWDSSDKCRVPAWCDRVLWVANNSKVVLEAYRSVRQLRISDHKPVYALCRVQVKRIDWARHKAKFEEALKEGDRRANEALPAVLLNGQINPTEPFNFGEVNFLEPKVHNLVIRNTGKFPVCFKFRNQPPHNKYCPDWLMITPSAHRIGVGSECSIGLQINVDKECAWKFNTGDGCIEEVLVLHLRNGRDFFITVKGKYNRSCFSQSLETLLDNQQQTEPQLVDLLGATDTALLSLQPGNFPVPKPLWTLVELIKAEGLDQSELFSGAGSQRDFNIIRRDLDSGQPVCFSELYRGVHSLVEALVRLLDSLPEPVIPRSFTERCLTAAVGPNPTVSCWQAVEQFPKAHRSAFEYLTRFLREVLQHKAANGATIIALSSLFSPILIDISPGRDPFNMNNNERERLKRKEICAVKFVENCLCYEPETALLPARTKTTADDLICF